jgi:hypothetical protein
MERPTCGTCPYWQACEQCGDGEAGGTCRRHPPSPPTSLGKSEIAKTADGAYRYDSHWSECAIWPHVDRVDWCGEHPDFPAWIARGMARSPKGRRLSELGFNDLRATGPLYRAGIDTIEQLLARSEEDIARLPGMGKWKLGRIKEALDRFGLKLKAD